jgi:hypothetical protein
LGAQEAGGVKERKELTLSRWWLIPAIGFAIAAFAYAQSIGVPSWLCFVCALCGFGTISTGAYVILVLYTAWKAERAETGWPYDIG